MEITSDARSHWPLCSSIECEATEALSFIGAIEWHWFLQPRIDFRAGSRAVPYVGAAAERRAERTPAMIHSGYVSGHLGAIRRAAAAAMAAIDQSGRRAPVRAELRARGQTERKWRSLEWREQLSPSPAPVCVDFLYHCLVRGPRSSSASGSRAPLLARDDQSLNSSSMLQGALAPPLAPATSLLSVSD